jgi:hypothetical protein
MVRGLVLKTELIVIEISFMGIEHGQRAGRY